MTIKRLSWYWFIIWQSFVLSSISMNSIESIQITSCHLMTLVPAPSHDTSVMRWRLMWGQQAHLANLVVEKWKTCHSVLDLSAGKNSPQYLWAGMHLRANRSYCDNQVSQTIKERSTRWNGAPSRARDSEGALAPSCRAPQGHDQILVHFALIPFFLKFRLATAASRRLSHLRRYRVAAGGKKLTCGCHRSKKNWNSNFSLDRSWPCGARQRRGFTGR